MRSYLYHLVCRISFWKTFSFAEVATRSLWSSMEIKEGLVDKTRSVGADKAPLLDATFASIVLFRLSSCSYLALSL